MAMHQRRVAFALTALLQANIGLAGDAADSAIAPTCPTLAGSKIRWLVPSSPGGGFDAYSRLLQPFLERQLQVQLRLENRPEAGGRMAAKLLSAADADGRTLGMLNGVGLLTANLMEPGTTPDPVNDFTLLGRISRNHVLLLVSGDSGIHTLDALLALAAQRPLVAAGADLGGSAFIMQPVLGQALNIPTALVSGYSGTPARVMALLRGEVDIILANHDSVATQLRSGEVRALLQLNDAPEGYPGPGAGEALPALTGTGGYAARRARTAGGDAQAAMRHAGALAQVAQAGRLLAAPAGLPDSLAQCLEQALGQAMASAQFKAAARRAGLTIAATGAAPARQETLAAQAALLSLQNLLAESETAPSRP
jgi:tripartite-type tricarboxylate transporter receptor subunit TctC